MVRSPNEQHDPAVWKERALLSKSTWSGGLEGMQYYATVSEERADWDNIMWLTPNNIRQRVFPLTTLSKSNSILYIICYKSMIIQYLIFYQTSPFATKTLKI